MDQIKLKEIFPFYYVGGGYFRQKGIPKEKVALILHGEEAIGYLLKQVNELIEKEQNKTR